MHRHSYIVSAVAAGLLAGTMPLFGSPVLRAPVLRAPIGTLNPRTWRRRCGARNARGPKPGWRKS